MATTKSPLEAELGYIQVTGLHRLRGLSLQRPGPSTARRRGCEALPQTHQLNVAKAKMMACELRSLEGLRPGDGLSVLQPAGRW